MKLPEKAPMWRQIIAEEKEKVIKVLTDASVYKLVSEFNKRYLYWSELKYRVKDKDERKIIWASMKLMRDGKEEKCFFNPIELKYSLLSDISRQLHYFDKQLAGNIISQTNALGLEEKYIISSLMEEAIASSMIEGAATTRKVAKDMLKEKRKPKNKSEKMILNNYEAMAFISKNKKVKLTPKFLLNVHQIVSKDTLREKNHEGVFRDNNDIFIGDDSDNIAHITPDYKEIEKLIKDLCDYANNEGEEFIHPIIKGIVIHFLIGYIHPFNDGNGRTARSIFYWFMLSRDYWLFEYLAISRRIVRSRKDYDLSYLFTEYDELDLTYFIKYNLQCINDSLNDLFSYVRLKQKEQEEIRNIVDKDLGLNMRQADIVRQFRQEPNKLFTIKEIKTSYGVTYATARSDLLFLVDNGIIKKRSAGKEFVFILN